MKMYYKRIAGLLLLAVLMVTISCKEDEVPVVGISSVDVTSAYPLDDVTLEGTNFSTVQFVFVGNRQATFQLDGDVLTFQVPEGSVPGMNTVTLAMVDNYRVTTQLEVLVRPTPVIQTISPSAAAAGQNVTIAGSSLDNLEIVTIGEVQANVVSNTANELVITVPAGLPANTPAAIKIVTQGGETTSESTFFVGENLVVNGELEAGSGDDFDNWGKWNGGAGMTATTGDAYTGRALKAVAVGGDAWRSQFVSDPVPTQVGVEYTLMIWIKGEQGTPGVGGNIRFSTNPSAQYSGNYDITGEWQQVLWTFTANEAATRVVLDLGVIQDAVYFVDNITFVATGNAGASNELDNSGFENGLTGWEVLNGNIEISTEDANGGSNSVKVSPAAGNPWDTQMAANGVPLNFGGMYEVKLWAKAAGPGGVMRVSVSQYDGNGADYFYGADVNLTEEWAEYTWTFEVTNDLPTHRLVLDMGAGSQVFYVDDVTLTEVITAPVENLIANGSFEDDLTDWEVLNGTIEVSTDDANDGSKSVLVSPGGGNPWDTQMAATGIELTFEGTYQVTLWAKGTGPGAVMRISMSQYDGNGADYFYGDDIAITEEWAEYTWTIEVTNDLPTHRLVLDMGAGTQAFYVDNITLTEQE